MLPEDTRAMFTMSNLATRPKAEKTDTEFYHTPPCPSAIPLHSRLSQGQHYQKRWLRLNRIWPVVNMIIMTHNPRSVCTKCPSLETRSAVFSCQRIWLLINFYWSTRQPRSILAHSSFSPWSSFPPDSQSIIDGNDLEWHQEMPRLICCSQDNIHYIMHYYGSILHDLSVSCHALKGEQTPENSMQFPCLFITKVLFLYATQEV